MPQATAVRQPPLDPDIVPASDVPLYLEVLDWLTPILRPAGFPKPLCKRLALIVSGLLARQKATMGQMVAGIEALAISKAKDESIARRLNRSFQDARLDPTLLPIIFRPLLPELLKPYVLAHAANAKTSSFHHHRFVGVVIVFDESSQDEHVHLAVAGIPVGATVAPLAVRTWTQNTPLPEGEYWTLVLGMLQEIQAMLPPELRDHVLLTGDRLYGVPRMVDILIALDWNWLLRVQGQTQVRLSDGTCRPIRTLAPKPGTRWTSGFIGESTSEPAESESVGVFKAAGWRRSQVVAVWAEGQAEPWLLVTSLSARLDRVVEYAQRWAIERLFLSWKSHGWDIEASGIHEPERLGRLLTGLAVATFWQLAMALPSAYQHLADLGRRAARATRQLRLPGFSAEPRPWAAKYSLFTWGANVAKATSLGLHTPALCWHLPYWEGRTWKETCRQTYLTRGQFSLTP